MLDVRKNRSFYQHLTSDIQHLSFSGGEGGIRTHGTVSRSQHFQCCQFNHSCTSPKWRPFNVKRNAKNAKPSFFQQRTANNMTSRHSAAVKHSRYPQTLSRAPKCG